MTWSEALANKGYRWLSAFIIFSIIFFLVFFPRFFDFIEEKPGIELYDPLLSKLPGWDLSIPIFIIIYSLLIATLVIHYDKPQVILMGLSIYSVVNFMRIISIYFITLEPPKAWIPLHDPFVSLVAYGSGFAKDLFFSGHTATLCVSIFIEPRSLFRQIKVIATIAVGVMLLFQHIHYTIDVIAAPLITYVAYYIVKRFLLGLETQNRL